jgi:hypothetical protein
MSFQETYRKLHGREPQHSEILEFERLVTVLDTTPNDAILSLLVALGYYKALYGEIPGKIQAASDTTLNKFKDAADVIANAAMAKTEETLTKAVVKASVEAANNTATQKAKVEVLRWRTVAGMVAAVLLAATFWYGHSTGEKTGYAAAIQAATDQKAAASWAATPQGELAFKLAKSGVLDGLAKCTLGKSWEIKKGACYPYPGEKGVTGWYLQ